MDSRTPPDAGDMDDAPDPDQPVRIPIEENLDLHPFRPEEVQSVVESYLEEAHAAGLRRVRIVHGRGTGTQRRMVQAVLARSPFVVSYGDAPPEAGGWGATVAEIVPR